MEYVKNSLMAANEDEGYKITYYFQIYLFL